MTPNYWLRRAIAAGAVLVVLVVVVAAWPRHHHSTGSPSSTTVDRSAQQPLPGYPGMPAVVNAADIYSEIEVNFYLLRRLLGVRTADGKQAKVEKLAKNEVIMVNIGSTATGAKVSATKKDAAKLILTSPACTNIGEKVALSRRIEKHWRLVGE